MSKDRQAIALCHCNLPLTPTPCTTCGLWDGPTEPCPNADVSPVPWITHHTCYLCELTTGANTTNRSDKLNDVPLSIRMDKTTGANAEPELTSKEMDEAKDYAAWRRESIRPGTVRKILATIDSLTAELAAEREKQTPDGELGTLRVMVDRYEFEMQQAHRHTTVQEIWEVLEDVMEWGIKYKTALVKRLKEDK